MDLTPQARRVLATRMLALEINDRALVAECEWYLARLGVGPDDYEPGAVTVVDDATVKRPARTRSRARS